MIRHNKFHLLIFFVLLIFNFCFSQILGEEKSSSICNKDSDCFNFGECHSTFDSSTGKFKKQCKCASDFVGPQCQFLNCPENPCMNKGICELTNSANKFKCHCPLGYSGSLCETKVPNACDTKKCANGKCRLNGAIDNAVCDCFYGFEGEKCDVKTLCNPASCSGHGICSSSNGTSISCSCEGGWKGDRCAVDINECEADSSLCRHGKCINSPGSYFCQCDANYIGVHCEKSQSNGCSSSSSTSKLDVCQNGGICSPGFNRQTRRSFTCKCPPGFKGDLCEENANECSRYDDPNLGDSGKNLSRCTNGGACIDGINEFNCVCPNGFTGKDCRANIDECSLHGTALCQNGGTCIDTYGSFQCACVYGFSGDRCEVNVDDCNSNLCYQGSTCIDRIRSYECECQEDRIGIYCQFENPCIAAKNKCQNNGQCFSDNSNGNYSCICDKGFAGENCETDIDECDENSVQSSPCYKGTCINTFGGYKCECEKGYAGPNCDILIDECEDRPCLNGGTCIDLAGDFKCICMPSWNGKHCEIAKPYSPACTQLICMHGGVCRKDPFGKEFCQCHPRFSGDTCELIKPDPCATNPCRNSAKCLPSIDFNSKICECQKGFSGEFCEKKIQSCTENPCLVGECVDSDAGFQCQCPPGFRGATCEINVNECTPNVCGNGICIDQVNGYSCKCPATLTGKNCEIPVTDPCQTEPCLNNATCMTLDMRGEFKCKCPKEFTGRHCETRTDICDPSNCQNGGFCSAGQHSCQCPQGFTGIFCERNQNKCSEVLCQNGGTCANLDNDFVCKCAYVWPFGFAGRFCEEKIDISKFSPEEKKEKEECVKNECEKFAGNGRCDPQCNFPGCNYDGGDCTASNLHPFSNCSAASYCKYVFRDNHCDEICNNEECLFDGFDCQEKVATKCPAEKVCLGKYGNGICDPECNSAACGWDGGDCTEAKNQMDENLVLTIITDPQNFVTQIAPKLLVTLSQLLHVSAHYQLDPKGNPMIYEWNSASGKGSLIHLESAMKEDSHAIQKRASEQQKGVIVYLSLDSSVCQELSSLSNVLHVDIKISKQNQYCFTNAQSAADMIAVDSEKDIWQDLNVSIAAARVTPRPIPNEKPSTIFSYVLTGIAVILISIVLVIFTATRVLKRKFVSVRKTFFPPTLEQLKNQEKTRHPYNIPYGNQYDRESLMPDLTGSTIIMPSTHGSITSAAEPEAKRGRREDDPSKPQRLFTKLHEYAASDFPITDEQIQELSNCAKIEDLNGRTCIHWAVEKKHEDKKDDIVVIEDIKKLVECGCPVDAQDDTGATALHLALRNGRTMVADFLLTKIDVNIQDDEGRTILYDAVSSKSLQLVQKILQIKNVDVNALVHVNDTALIRCCRNDINNDMFHIAEALIRHPEIQLDKTANKSELQYTGKTAIHEAAACNSIEILKLLIKNGAAVTAHDAHDQTPLFLAVQSNQIEAVKLLISYTREHRIDINAPNDCGETPLHVASTRGYKEIENLLINAGAHIPPARLNFEVFPAMELPKYPTIKAIHKPQKSGSSFAQAEKKTAGNKRKKIDNEELEITQKRNQQTYNNNAQQNCYSMNDPMPQQPQFYAPQMYPQMGPLPQQGMLGYPPANFQHQQNEYYQQPCQNPSMNYSSNPPSTHLPQCPSTSPHIIDSAYGSPNSYQNLSTNTSGNSDTSSFASPPNSHDPGFWPNSSPDTIVANNSTQATPIQPNYPSVPMKQEYYGFIDNNNQYIVTPEFQQQQQYHQQQQQRWDYQIPHPSTMYNSAMALQHYPAYSQPQAYYPAFQKPPHIPYPQHESMMHRSASFAAFPSQ